MTAKNSTPRVAAKRGLKFALRTSGSESGGRLLLGSEERVHISTQPIFNGDKKALCQGDVCKYCGSDKPVTRVVDIPAIVDGEPCFIKELPVGVHNILAEKASMALDAGLVLENISFSLHKKRWRWEVLVDTPLVVNPGGSDMGRFETGLSTTELDVLIVLERWAAESLAQSGASATNNDWLGWLKEHFSWSDGKAKDLVDKFVQDGRLKLRSP